MTAPAPTRIAGRRIRRRLLALAAMGMFAQLALLTWVGAKAVDEFERRVLADRVLLARLVAARVDDVVARELASLQELATGLEAGERGDGEGSLRHAFMRHRVLLDEVFLLDAGGRLLAQEPFERPIAATPQLLERLRAPGLPGFGPVVLEPDGARVYALVPVSVATVDPPGALGASINLFSGAKVLLQLLSAVPLEEGESIDLVDGAGTTIASSDPTRRLLVTDHAKFLAGLIRDRSAASGSCHGCHAGDAGRVTELLAFQPLASAHWGISVRQPMDRAHAFATTLARHAILLALLLVALALVFAWGVAISVTRPLTLLREAAERLASGELSQPIESLPDDEVGRLGVALDGMRIALKNSVDRVERANEVLEQRVHDRTAELVLANRELAARDEARRAALRKVISAQEDERRRIARELHDEASQTLTALRLGLDAALPSISDPATRARVEEARTLAVATLEGVRRVMVDLRPSVLDDLGLQAAIRWYADRTLTTRGVSVRCEFSGLEGRLPPEIETAVFRTVQEAISNIARHARAETVLVQATRRDGRLVIEIEDDGVGFDPASLPALGSAVRGLGLLGMRERAELVGGTFRFTSSPGAGTHVVVSVPVEEGPAHAEDPRDSR